MNALPQPGDIVTSSQLPGPARVISAALRGANTHLQVVVLDTNQFYDREFAPGEFAVRRVELDADGERFRLAALAERIRAAAQYDPQFAVSASQVEPLPHQIDAVYNHLLRSPRIRFLLADDPGAGKTIMAGLLLKELQYRGAVEQVLIVTPANLTLQWRDELRDKFGEQFEVVRRDQLRAFAGPEVWRRHPRAIISVDLARRAEVRETLTGMHWDLVIVDEAHKMAAYKYGAEVDKTQGYQLGEALAAQTDHLLLMTATPHRGNPDNFRLLLALLDPDLFGTNDTLNDLLTQTTVPIFLRRLKERMTNFDGTPLFTNRSVETVTYELGGAELVLYDRVTEYVRERFQRAESLDSRTKRNVGLALLVLQRRLASSLRAIRISLERREEKLHTKLRDLHMQRKANTLAPTLYAPDDEPDDDAEREEAEDVALGVTSARTAFEVEAEIAEVRTLVTLAQEAETASRNGQTERKLEQLRDLLNKPLADGLNMWQSRAEKLLIFTENRDTLDYLTENLQAWGFSVAHIYGGMDQDTRRAEQTRFKDPDGAQIMVATEAAGEGINLQFCRLMINYDIPWNPNRLEQRMGRIHRFGQEYDVRIFNLVAENTREGEVLTRVLAKLDAMRHDLGSDSVYDIIGDLLSAKDLAELVEQAVKERKSLVERRAMIAHSVEAKIAENENRRKSQIALSDSLASDRLAQASLDEIREQVRTANEQRLVPEYIERFVVSAVQTLCADKNMRAEIKPRAGEPGVWQVDIPNFIRLAAPKGYTIPQRYTHVIFRKELRDTDRYAHAAFVVPGHPLFEALVALVRQNYGPLLTSGAVFAAEDGTRGLFWLLEMTVRDGTGAVAGKRLVGVLAGEDGTLTTRDPLALLDAEPVPPPADAPRFPVPPALAAGANNPAMVEAWTRETVLTPYLDDLRTQRNHEANVREEYLQRSLNVLMADQDSKILRHMMDEAKQPDQNQYDIGLRSLEEGKEKYEARLAMCMAESERMRSLGADPPVVVGVCAYVPPPVGFGDDDEERDPVTEDVAMAVTMAYEQQHDRDPDDVSRDNLGFDIKSRGPREFRYIEVKGRKGSGAVMLTANEMYMSGRFGREYWLYVVYDCATPVPRLVRVQNPGAVLNFAEHRVTASKFRVNQSDVLVNGE